MDRITVNDRSTTSAPARPVEVAPPQRPSADPPGLDAAAWRNVRLMHLLERVTRAFNEAGVPLMALKGAALLLQTDRRPDERPMVDLDLLVRPADVDRALGLLEDLGCLRRHTAFREDFFPRYYYEVEYTAGTILPIEIDLHVRPFRVLRYARTVPDDALWARARRIRIGSATVLVPAADDMLVHLAVHTAIHGNGERKWLEDIKGWADAHRGSIDWDRFVDTARAWRLAVPILDAFDRVEYVLGPVCPLDVTRRLAHLPVGWRDRLALRHAPKDRAHLTKSFLVNLATTPGLRFKLGYAATVLFPDREYMDGWCTRHDCRWRRWAHVLRHLRPLLERLPGLGSRLTRVEVRHSGIHGQGVFATRDVARGKVIARYRGRPIDREGTYVSFHRDQSGREVPHEITGPLRYVNHCCRPNAQLVDFKLVALRRIPKGREITISYGDGVCNCPKNTTRPAERGGDQATSNCTGDTGDGT